MKHLQIYLENIIKSIQTLNYDSIEKAIISLKNTRKKGGRLFLIGVGGSAGNASHAVNDFRKLCNIDAYLSLIHI